MRGGENAYKGSRHKANEIFVAYFMPEGEFFSPFDLAILALEVGFEDSNFCAFGEFLKDFCAYFREFSQVGEVFDVDDFSYFWFWMGC